MRHRPNLHVGDRLVKGLLFTIGICVLLAAPAVEARDPRSGFGPLFQVQAQGQPAKKGPGWFQRGERDKQGGHDKRYQGRMTQEERQNLHRDLDRANREIYRR